MNNARSGLEREPGKLRIAVVSPEHWNRVVGGAEYQAKLLIERLAANHDVEIRYFASRTGERTAFDSHSVVAVGRNGFLSKYGSFWDVLRLYRALKRFAPHVIYQRVGCSYTGVAATYARRHGIACYWHVASEGDTDALPPVSLAFSKPHKYLERLLLDIGRSRADRIIVQSERQKRLLRDKLGLQAFEVIRNFHPEPGAAPDKDGGLGICWVANLKLLKEPERLFDIAGLVTDLPDTRFLMVGNPYPEPDLQAAFMARLSESSNVDYIDGLPQEEVNQLLSRSKLLINTSPREGFSNVFIQAWMREVPVFTLGVNPDGLLDDGKLGEAFDSEKDLAMRIRELARVPERLQAMGMHCREFALATFSMKNADRLASLLVASANDARLTAAGGRP